MARTSAGVCGLNSCSKSLTWFAFAAGACVLLMLIAGTASAAERAATGSSVFPAAPERDLVARACTACHAPELVIAKRHTPEEWDDIIAKMVDRGAQANEAEQLQILTYLVRFFGPTNATAP